MMAHHNPSFGVVATTAICTWLFSSAAMALSPAEVFTKVSPSTWGITTYDKDGLKLGSGSAVVIAPETLITNCHVLRKASRISVTSENVSIGATLEMWDTLRDVCQVKAKNLKAPAVKIGTSSALHVGQSVFSVGNPLGLELTLGAGLISSLRKDEQAQLVAIQTTTPVSQGSSGGGLFDDQARLVGITTFQKAEGQNLNFAIPVEWIKELPLRHQQARSKEELEQTAKATVQTAKVETAKAWRYQFSDMRGRRQEITVLEKNSGTESPIEEAKIGDLALEGMQWPKASMFRMRSGAGIEWMEVSPTLFKNPPRSIRGASLLGDFYNIDIRARGEEQVMVGGKPYPAMRLEIVGQKEQPPPSVQMMYSFKISAWYSRDLGRVVRSQFSTLLMAGSVRDRSETLLVGLPE